MMLCHIGLWGWGGGDHFNLLDNPNIFHWIGFSQRINKLFTQHRFIYLYISEVINFTGFWSRWTKADRGWMLSKLRLQPCMSLHVYESAVRFDCSWWEFDWTEVLRRGSLTSTLFQPYACTLPCRCFIKIMPTSTLPERQKPSWIRSTCRNWTFYTLRILRPSLFTIHVIIASIIHPQTTEVNTVPASQKELNLITSCKPLAGPGVVCVKQSSTIFFLKW